MASVESIRKFVRLSFKTDCCLDFVTEEIPVRDVPSVLRGIKWPSFDPKSVGVLLDLMEPDTRVRVGRCHGPLLEFSRPGMRYGGTKGMFKRAVEKAGGADALGFSRMLGQWRSYMLLWNDE